MRQLVQLGSLISAFLFASSGYTVVLNNPYPTTQSSQKIYYTSFTEQPKTLDPARSYSSPEYQFIAQIYEPPLEYDYLARPYKLVPLSAGEMPLITYLDKQLRPISNLNQQSIAYSLFTIHIKQGLHYQPHPAFARNEAGDYLYHHLPPSYFSDNKINVLSDFVKTGEREVLASDYLYEIKRMANPSVSSPIYGLMSEYIVGFKEFASQLPDLKNRPAFVDLRKYELSGLKQLDNYSFQVMIKGQYPQFLFWLAMPFFSPIPWEADKFYSQPGMKTNNLSFDWYPIGSGPFMLIENNPNHQMVLRKNPNYHTVFNPHFVTEKDEIAGYLQHVGETMPFVDEVIYTLEKESIPRWNKFLQGYYDLSGVTSDSYDQAIEISPEGRPILSKEMQAKKIRLTQTMESHLFYLGFNMLDPVVGGNTEQARLLRRAISIALNLEEYIALFYNGRGKTAQGPIPPGIVGHDTGLAGMNPYVYHVVNGKIVRRTLAEAKAWMKKAGYTGGINPKTGKPLVLNYDIATSTRPDEHAQLDWMRKQFSQIGIDLNVLSTDYNRFQEKMRSGNSQIYYWGWNADYPDPENFLLLLYGPNGKVKKGGENASNYNNPEYDHLFDKMKNRPNDATRKQLLATMLELLRRDAPWIWGINTELLTLSQQWISPVKPHSFTYNTLKYLSVDTSLRAKSRWAWNQAKFWPLFLFAGVMGVIIAPVGFIYSRQERKGAPRVKIV